METKKTIITYGTFDLFHVGHVRLLKRLKKMGDRLVVGLSNDDFNRLKEKKTIMNYEQRKEVLESCCYVDEVFEEYEWEQKEQDIIRYEADVFAMGSDWAGKFDNLQKVTEVVYLPRTKDISTTEIKELVHNLNVDKKNEILHLISNVNQAIQEL